MVNQIILGDSYEIIKQIPDKSIDLIYTDIPYLFGKGGSGKSRISRNIVAKTRQIADMSNGVDWSILDEFVRVMKKVNCFIWCSKEQILYLLNYFKARGCMFDILTWNKTNPTPMTNNIFLPDIEYCLYFRETGVRLNNGYKLKSKWYISTINVADKKHFLHPTIKPLDLVKRHIWHATRPNDIVLDCFAGSGTTAVAARETGRRYIGVEIDPRYHAIAVNRLAGMDMHGQTNMWAG